MLAMVLLGCRALHVLRAVSCVQSYGGGSSRLQGHRIHPERDRCPVPKCSGDFLGQKFGAGVLICSENHILVRNANGTYDLKTD